MKERIKDTNRSSRKGALLCLFLCALCLILTVFGETSSRAAQAAVSMCLSRLIPALFPYMVVSSMLVSTGAADSISRRLPAARIFGLPAEASSAVILGFLCGFPLGAKTAAELYRRGTVTKAQAEVLISVANNTGPSFVVSVIGAAFWNSAAFGWFLYFAQLVSAVIAGMFVNRIIARPDKIEAQTSAPAAKEPLLSAFLFAVKDSVGACLNVCGFVTVFAVVISYISCLTDLVSPILTSGVAAIFELTEASRLGAFLATSGSRLGGFFCGFALGFSGISVFCQAGAFTFPLGLSLKRTFFVKLLQGLMCGALGFLLCEKYMPCTDGAFLQTFLQFSQPLYIASAALITVFSVKILIKAYKM